MTRWRQASPLSHPQRGLLPRFDANVYFTCASKDLLTASVERLKAGSELETAV